MDRNLTPDRRPNYQLVFMKVLLAIWLGVGLMGLSAARAEDANPPDPIDKEINAMLAHDPSTQGQIHAFQAAEKKWSAEMNRALGHLQGHLPAQQRELLAHSQRDWEAFRQSEEALRISFNAGRRGTLVGVLAVEARASFVRDRALTLRRYEEKLPQDH